MDDKTVRRGYRWSQLLASILLALTSLNASKSALAQVSQQDINAIVRTREIAVQALNSRDFSKVEPFLHPNFTITTVDNRVFHKVAEFEKYWNQQFSGSIEKIVMETKVDDPRRFLSPNTATSYGDAIATFYFKDGNVGRMGMRWTAVLQKFQGKWTIQSLHFSSNLLDNPVLNGSQRMGITMAVAAGVGGFLVGAIAMFLLRRKPKQPTETVS